jgi:hypothetical protein
MCSWISAFGMSYVGSAPEPAVTAAICAFSTGARMCAWVVTR